MIKCRVECDNDRLLGDDNILLSVVELRKM